MSDLFQKEVPKAFIDSVFATMEQVDWHVFQILTKRGSLPRNYVNERYARLPAPPHIWVGASIEVKQWGGKTSKAGGNHLDGRSWLRYPRISELAVRTA